MKQGSKQTNINKPFSFPKRGGGGAIVGLFFIIIFSEPGLVRLFAMGAPIFVAFVLEKRGEG
jgi:hypothetical protein